MAIKEGWLKCNISPGMFPNEYIVNYERGDNAFSFFAHESLINKIINGVRVTVIQCKGDLCSIFLPVDPMGGTGNKTVTVPTADIIK